MHKVQHRLRQVAQHIDTLAEQTGNIVSWLTLGMVLVTGIVVTLRYVFNIGSIALQESVTYLHATVFMLGAAYTLKHDAHVRVDIFYQRASRRGRALTDLLGTLLLLLPVCLFILYDSIDYVAASWAVHEGSREAGGLNGVYLLKTLIPVMAALMLLQGVAQIIHNLLIVTGRDVTGSADSGMDREL